MKENPQGVPELLAIDHLSVTLRVPGGQVYAVRETSLVVARATIHGLVGESGCGKSTLGLAIMGYLPRNAQARGSILFEGRDLTCLPARDLQRIRGNRIAMVYQDPDTALNPMMRVGLQVEEVLREHLAMPSKSARQRSIELLSLVELPEPDSIWQRYPHELSGGMKQRAVIAMAIACEPDLLIMDEPTTALDVTTQANILDLIVALRDDTGAGVLYITHDMGVVARVADEVTVMYAGQNVETTSTRRLFASPAHPYTVGLLSCIPTPPASDEAPRMLHEIPGSVYPSTENSISSCLFVSRCPLARSRCKEEAPLAVDVGLNHQARCFFWKEVVPDLWGSPYARSEEPTRAKSEVVLSARSLRRYYRDVQPMYPRFGASRRQPVRAVDEVSFEVQRGWAVGLVGESGSGKSTVARLLVGLIARDDGDLTLRGTSLSPALEGRTNEQRSALSLVFQNPTDSLNPRHKASHSVIRSLEKLAGVPKNQVRAAGLNLFEAVGLGPELFDRPSIELSGGQQQRVSLAAAFAAKPALIVADEPVSSLDVSVQAQILNLINTSRRRTGTSFLFISHDLGVVSYVCQMICVLYAGHIVEQRPTNQGDLLPAHPYTEALMSAVLVADLDISNERIRLPGGTPTLREELKGCCFAGRCPRKVGIICDEMSPPRQVSLENPAHIIYCHIPWDGLIEMQEARQKVGAIIDGGRQMKDQRFAQKE